MAAAEAKQLYVWVDSVNNPRAYALYVRLGYQPLQADAYPFHWEFVDSEGNTHVGDSWRVDMVKSLSFIPKA